MSTAHAYLSRKHDESDDELDILSAPMAELSASTPARRYPQRLRVSSISASASKAKSPQGRKRKRTLSLSTAHNKPQRAEPAKKPKLEEKKALTIVINTRKSAVDAARRRWLYEHRQMFMPLLPLGNTFFEHLRAEIEAPGAMRDIVPFHELEEQPKLIVGGTMKDYQLHGLSFLVWMHKNGMNSILGDEMGLGKTLQTIALLAYIRQHHKGSLDPHLIICPLSVLSSWLSELARWAPSLRALRFHGVQSEREKLKADAGAALEGIDVLVTTYEAFVAEDSWLKKRRWTYCVLDEGHKIKNAETNLAGKLQGVGAMHRLILTGTPVHNNLLELWSLLHWLCPAVFTQASERAFRDAFDLTRGLYSLPFLSAAQELLKVVMLRRTKATVELNVPPREELTVFVPLAEAQRFWTYRLLTRLDSGDLEQIFGDGDDAGSEASGQIHEGRKEVREHLQNQMRETKSEGQNRWKRLMNLLMQLRKVCDHPYLLPDAEPEPYFLGEHLVASSSKMIAIDKILADILPKGERVLIFSQWTGMLDLLEDFMTLRSIPYARLDGGTTRPRRALNIKLFQQEVSPYKVFLISTKAGGLGINLTKASTVIMCDSDWNPQNDLQAIARAHRIGQTKICKVYRLICRGSVEDQMLDRIRRKLFLSIKVMGSDNPSSTTESSQLGSSELMDILKKGSSALSGADACGMDLARFLDAPISEILDASRERGDVRDAKMRRDLEGAAAVEGEQKLIEDAEEEERKLLSGVAQVQSRMFEGRVVQRAQLGKKKEMKQIASEWQELQKRARDNRIVVVDGMEFIVAPVEQLTTLARPEKTKNPRSFGSEDWCIYCRDGGDLVLCTRCPRVFHADCHDLTEAQLKRNAFTVCPQHQCSDCKCSTAGAGGMLFKCQTCTQAFCEDCLPEGELDAIGDVLPEFALLGFGEKSTSYYIRCHDCRKHFAEYPAAWRAWQEEMKETQAKLDAMP